MQKEFRECIELEEGAFDEERGIARVTVIRPGFNTSKSRHYAREMLERDAHVFEGAMMNVDHMTDTQHDQRPVGSIRDVAGYLQNVSVNSEDGRIVGEAHIIDDGMKSRLSNMKKAGLSNKMGVSIRALCGAVQDTMESVETMRITSIEKCRSVDFVTLAGAGGGVEVYESEEIEAGDFSELAETTKPEQEVNAMDNVTAELEQVKAKVLEAEEAKTAKEAADTQEAHETEVSKLKAQVAEMATDKAKADTKSAIESALDASDLIELSKARVRGHFEGKESADGIDAAIAEESALISALRENDKKKDETEESVEVSGLGPSDTAVNESAASHGDRMLAHVKENGDDDYREAFLATQPNEEA